MKRVDNAMHLENAYLAQQHWEQEKDYRNALHKQQRLSYINAVREKQQIERKIHDQRLKTLNEQQQIYTDTIRREIQAKKHRLKYRLEKIANERNAMLWQRERERQQKCDRISIAQQKNRIDRELQLHECNNHLDERMTRADAIRNHYLDVYRRRINEENERHQQIHAINYEEVKDLEEINLQRLKDRLAVQDRKSKAFLVNKSQWVEQSRDRAHVTATLRDIIRKSVTPNDSYRNYLNILNID